MMKRLRWFIAGAVAGAAGAEYTRFKTRRLASRHTAAAVVRSAVKERAHDVADALRVGREAMREKEAELLARRDGPVAVATTGGARVLMFDPGVHRPAVAGPRRSRR